MDNRLITGGALRYGWQLGENLNAEIGADFRFDDVRRRISIKPLHVYAVRPFDGIRCSGSVQERGGKCLLGQRQICAPLRGFALGLKFRGKCAILKTVAAGRTPSYCQSLVSRMRLTNPLKFTTTMEKAFIATTFAVSWPPSTHCRASP